MSNETLIPSALSATSFTKNDSVGTLPKYCASTMELGIKPDAMKEIMKSESSRQLDKPHPARLHCFNKKFGFHKKVDCVSEKCLTCPLGRGRFAESHALKTPYTSNLLVRKDSKIKKCDYIYETPAMRRRRMAKLKAAKPRTPQKKRTKSKNSKPARKAKKPVSKNSKSSRKTEKVKVKAKNTVKTKNQEKMKNKK